MGLASLLVCEREVLGHVGVGVTGVLERPGPDVLGGLSFFFVVLVWDGGVAASHSGRLPPSCMATRGSGGWRGQSKAAAAGAPEQGGEQEVGLLSSSSTPRSWEPLDTGGVVMPYGGGGGRRGGGVWGRACQQVEIGGGGFLGVVP